MAQNIWGRQHEGTYKVKSWFSKLTVVQQAANKEPFEQEKS